MTLRIRNAPAVVEWSDLSSMPRSSFYLAEQNPQSVQLSLHFNQQQQVASFKIRVLLGAQKETASKDGEYLHLLVHPSDVILLLQDPAHHVPDGAVLHGPTICLRLVLSKPVSIAAPSDISLPQKGRNSRLLSLLRLLSKQTVLTIHFGQHHVSNPGAVQQLCQAFCNGSVKQHPRHNTLQDFYPGRGAMVIEDFDDFAGFESKTPASDSHNPGDIRSTTRPPPYAEALPAAQPANESPGAQPPPSLFAQPPRKRQRASSSRGTMAPLDAHDFYTEFLAQQKAQTEAFFLQQAQMGKMLAHLSNHLEQIPDNVNKLVNERLSKTREEELGKWEEAIKTIVQQEVEEAVVTSLESEREGLVDDVRGACLNELKNDLESGLVSITLPRHDF